MKVYVCLACGKRSHDKYGYNTINTCKGWDESCFLNCIHVSEDRLVLDDKGRVTSIQAQTDTETHTEDEEPLSD